MRISCPEGYLRGSSFEEDLRVLRQVGCDEIELPSSTLADSEEDIMTVLRRQDFPISALWAGAGGSASAVPEERREAIDAFEQIFRLAARCGVQKVVSTDHGVSAGESNLEEARRRLLGSLAEIVPVAEQLGVVLAVEPLSAGALIASTRDGVWLCDQFASTSLQLNLDTYWMRLVGEDPAESFRLAAKYVGHVHFSDYVWDPGGAKRPFPGKGEIDFRSCLAALREQDYQGFICIEAGTLGPEPMEDELRNTVAYLRALQPERADYGCRS